MNTMTTRTFVIALGGLILALSPVGTAGAAIRDSGAKARGEFGTGFYNPQTRHSTTGDNLGPVLRLDTVPSPTGRTTESTFSPASLLRGNMSPAVEASQLAILGNRTVVTRSRSGSATRRYNHVYRRQRPGTGFWK